MNANTSYPLNQLTRLTILFFTLIGSCCLSEAQMITGVWHGKINRQKVEVKIIQQGDNLLGTAYYYDSPDRYRRYSIKGYFDPQTNEAVWWDDELIEEKNGRSATPGKVPLLSRADFNCPGAGKMMLDGNASSVDDLQKKLGPVDLNKTNREFFRDEWDYVIENYLVGANHPDIIDSIRMLSARLPLTGEEVANRNPLGQGQTSVAAVPIMPPDIQPEPVQPTEIKVPAAPLTIEQKFSTRKKVFAVEIPVTGDSIELRFYDNAQIDGDSISLFLNERLIFQHIRLSEKAYTIKLPVAELDAVNELIMVAENLGSIPPNTSYMVAIAGEKRYEARLESTEGASAMIRLVRK